MIINGRIAKATMFNGRVEFRDSFLIIPVPLAQFEKDKIEYWKFEREHRERHKVEILRYMRKDCSALFELVDNFVRTFGSGLTLAGTAFRELKKPVTNPKLLMSIMTIGYARFISVGVSSALRWANIKGLWITLTLIAPTPTP